MSNSHRETNRRAMVTPAVQALSGLSSIVLGVLVSVLDGTVAGVVLILLGTFGLALATLRWRQARHAARRTTAPSPVEPSVGRLYIALIVAMFLGAAVYMFVLGTKARSDESSMAIVDFATAIVAAFLGTYMLVGLVLSHRIASGRSSRVMRKLYPNMPDLGKRTEAKRDDLGK